MKKKSFITLLLVAAFFAAIVVINANEPSRVTEQRKAEAKEAKRLVDDANKAQNGSRNDVGEIIGKKASEILAQKTSASAETTPASAESFQVELECSKGTVVIEIHPEWSPLGVEQFRKIIDAGLFDEARFFRVVPGFVIQWGIPADPEKSAQWSKRNIADEPVKTSNLRGTITYAKSSQPNSRTTQMFVNLVDNPRLDGMGFAPIGKVIKGMDVIDKINSEYGQSPEQDQIESRGNAYLKQYFPRLDYIKTTKVVSAAPATTPPAPATPPAGAPPASQAPAPAAPKA